MRSFSEIFAIAAQRKGGSEALEALLAKPLSREVLASRPNSDWLEAMAKCLFQAGFSWQVIDTKWPGFEIAFDGFDPAAVARYNDDEVDRLLADERIVRNHAKICAVIENARFVETLAISHGSAGSFFGAWPSDNFVGLLEVLNDRGARLGGITGQRMLRAMGCESFILSPDVVARLSAEGVVDRPPTSKRDVAAVQSAFNAWSAQSGRTLTEISQVLALSV